MTEAEVLALRAAGKPFGLSARRVLIRLVAVLAAEPVLLANLIDDGH